MLHNTGLLGVFDLQCTLLGIVAEMETRISVIAADIQLFAMHIWSNIYNPNENKLTIHEWHINGCVQETPWVAAGWQ